MIFCERLKTLRKDRNLTQVAIAETIGVTERGYRKYESGVSEPTMGVLVALADTLGVSIDYLVGRSDDPRRI